MKAFFQDDNHALSKFRCDVLSVYNCNYGYYSAYELLICVSSISNERSIINDYLTQKWKCFFSQMFSFHCSTLNTKTWDQQVKQDTPTIYSYYSEPPGPHWLLISWNFPFYLASNLNIFLSFDKTDSVTQKSVPRIFFSSLQKTSRLQWLLLLWLPLWLSWIAEQASLFSVPAKPLFRSLCARQVILKCWTRDGVIVPAICSTILFYLL